MAARYLPAHLTANFSLHMARLDANHTTPQAGDFIIGDDWLGSETRRLITCDDWHRARFRYLASENWEDGPKIATNILITGSRARPNFDYRGGFWMRCRIETPGDGQPDTSYPGWILCTARDN